MIHKPDTIKFTLVLENKTGADEIDPTVSVGIGWDEGHQFTLAPGRNFLRFEEPIYEHGCQYLTLHVCEGKAAPRYGSFEIVDLCINGLSMTHKIRQGIYYPHYDEGCPKRPPGEYCEKPGCNLITNRGTWRWHFTTPLYRRTFDLFDK